MASLSSSKQDETPSMSVQESRRLSIQHFIQSLRHACQCCQANCPVPQCHQMKSLVLHTRGCKNNGGCPACKQVIVLCGHHAKHCQEDTCPMPYCPTIKQQIRQQQAQMGHPMAIPQQSLPSPTAATPGIPMHQSSTSQTPQPGMYPQPLPSPTPASPGIPMHQPSSSQMPQPGIYPQPLPSPTTASPGIPMHQPSTSQTPQPCIYPQPLPSPTPASPGIPMHQPSTSQTPQPGIYPQLLPSPGIPMHQPSTSQTPQPGIYPQPLLSPTTASPGIPMHQPSTSQTPQPCIYPQPLPSPTPASPGISVHQPSTSQTPQPLLSPTPATPGILMQQPSTLQTPQPGIYPQSLPSPTPATHGIQMQQPSTSQTPQPAPQPSLGGLSSPGFPNVAGIQSQDKSTSLLSLVPPAQPPPAPYEAAHQIELEKEQIYWFRIEDEISMHSGMVNPTVGPVNSLLQMGMIVQHPGPIAPPPIMHGMQPGWCSTAPMPQQNIQHPGIEMTAAQQAVVKPQLQEISQQQACNKSLNALQDLLQTLRAPSSPQQQQNVINILKLNPQLMAAFIKKRTANYVANLSGMQPQQAPQQPPQQPGMYPQPVPSPAPATPGISMQLPSTPQFMQPAPQPSLGGMASLGSPNIDESINPQESRRLSILRHIQSLVHACQCHHCSLPSCQKMKRVMQHLNGCQRKPNCSVCRNLIALCCYHAKRCQENTCPVLFCLNIKHKLRQQQIQHRLQQAQLMRQRMATRNTRTQGRTKG